MVDAASEAAAESFAKLMQSITEALPKPRGRSMSPMQSGDAELPKTRGTPKSLGPAPTTPPWRKKSDMRDDELSMGERLKNAMQEVEVIKQDAEAIKQQLRPYTGSDDPSPVSNLQEPGDGEVAGKVPKDT